jgi:hypothetical protein
MGKIKVRPQFFCDKFMFGKFGTIVRGYGMHVLGNLTTAGKFESNTSGNQIIIDPDMRAIRMITSSGAEVYRLLFGSLGATMYINSTISETSFSNGELIFKQINGATVQRYADFGPDSMTLRYGNGGTVAFHVATGASVLAVIMKGLPTNASGLESGQLWRDGNTLKIVV